MAISTTNTATTTAPKCNIIFDRVIDRDAIILKLILAEEVEVPPKPKIELSIKPKRTVKLELRGEIVRWESITVKRGIH